MQRPSFPGQGASALLAMALETAHTFNGWWTPSSHWCYQSPSRFFIVTHWDPSSFIDRAAARGRSTPPGCLGGCWGWAAAVPTPQDAARSTERTGSRELRRTGASMGLRGMDVSVGLWAWRAEGNGRLDGAVGMTGRDRRLRSAAGTWSDRAGHRRRRLPGSRQGRRGRRRRERQQPATEAEGGAGRAPRVRRAGPGRATPGRAGEVNGSGYGKNRCRPRAAAGTRGAGARAFRPRGAAARDLYGLTLLSRRLMPPLTPSLPSPCFSPARSWGSRLRWVGLMRCWGPGAALPPSGYERGWGEPWQRGQPWAGARSSSQPPCAGAGRGLCPPRLPEVPLPPCQAAGLREGKGQPARSLRCWSGRRHVCLACDWKITLVVLFVSWGIAWGVWFRSLQPWQTQRKALTPCPFPSSAAAPVPCVLPREM